MSTFLRLLVTQNLHVHFRISVQYLFVPEAAHYTHLCTLPPPSYEIAELLGGHPVGAAALSTVADRKVEEEGAMTVEQEKEALKRRLAELEEGERRALETRLGGKRLELEEVKDDYRSRREVAMAEIQRLDTHVKALQVFAPEPAPAPAPTARNIRK